MGVSCSESCYVTAFFELFVHEIRSIMTQLGYQNVRLRKNVSNIAQQHVFSSLDTGIATHQTASKSFVWTRCDHLLGMRPLKKEAYRKTSVSGNRSM